jgi:hypothetical protein
MAYPEKYREVNLAGVKRYRARNRLLIQQAKARPCMDCGESYPPYVMDLDHRDGTKILNVGAMTGHSPDKVQAEIDKCDVVCSNCHRLRTFNPILTITCPASSADRTPLF